MGRKTIPESICCCSDAPVAPPWGQQAKQVHSQMGSCPFYPAEAVGGPSARGEGNHSSAALPLQPSESSSPLLYTHQQALEGQVVESGRVQLVSWGLSGRVTAAEPSWRLLWCGPSRRCPGTRGCGETRLPSSSQSVPAFFSLICVNLWSQDAFKFEKIQLFSISS